MERYQTYGQLRGDFTVEKDGKKHRLINVFPTSAYRSEALRILQTQQEFNPQITDEFINRYLEILTGKRKYYHGPGNEKSRTELWSLQNEWRNFRQYFWNSNLGNVHFIQTSLEQQKLPTRLKNSIC